jgi:hypothetical protein
VLRSIALNTTFQIAQVLEQINEAAPNAIAAWLGNSPNLRAEFSLSALMACCVKVRIDGNIENRRLDIVDSPNIRAIEYKTGYQYRSADNLWELRRDAQLVKEGWKITWVFRDQVAKPLLEELDRNGIKYTIQGKK